MWSNCYSLVSAAESLQCIRISALLLSLEGWDEFRHGSEQNSLCSFRHPWLHLGIQGNDLLGCHQISIREWSPAAPGTSDPCSSLNCQPQRQWMGNDCAWAAVAALGTSLQPHVHFNILIPMDLWRCRMSCLYLLGPWRNLGMSSVKKLLMSCGKSLKHIWFGIDSLCAP